VDSRTTAKAAWTLTLLAGLVTLIICPVNADCGASQEVASASCHREQGPALDESCCCSDAAALDKATLVEPKPPVMPASTARSPLSNRTPEMTREAFMARRDVPRPELDAQARLCVYQT